jgi:hypothetical protein
MRLYLLRAFCFFLTCAIPSFGCECGPPGHASRYIKEASIVFVGKVVFTDDDGSGKFIQKTLVHFEVERAFKGLGPEMHDVWVDPEVSHLVMPNIMSVSGTSYLHMAAQFYREIVRPFLLLREGPRPSQSHLE